MTAAKQLRIQVKKTESMLSDVAKSIGSAIGTVAAKTGIVAKPAARRARHRRPSAAISRRRLNAPKRRRPGAAKRRKARR